jgi:3-hydroxybutyryl-CoA dehydrogenase
MERGMQIQRVAVLGGGLMGSGIAEACAVAGFDVIVREIDDDALARLRVRLDQSLAHAAERGRLEPAQLESALGRIQLTVDLHDLADVDLVIEAIPEDVEEKTRVLSEAAAIVAPHAIVASNTSSIPITQLAAVVPQPERVIGLHFFSPVPVMRLVEVVVALDSAEAAIEAGRAFVQRLGKTPIDTRDRSGFIVNMLLVPYLMAAVRMFEEGFAEAEAIDEGMQLGCGHPMGPLRLCDLIGLDVLYSVCDSLYEEFKRPEYAPPPLLKRMVASNRLGRKSGRGFYEYRTDRAPVTA